MHDTEITTIYNKSATPKLTISIIEAVSYKQQQCSLKHADFFAFNYVSNESFYCSEVGTCSKE